MTCVWDALRTKIRSDDLRTILGLQAPTPRDLVMALKSRNIATVGVRWQGKSITTTEMTENMKAIECHDINSISNGYDMSVCDPYLLLVCFLFKIRIVHQYLGTKIVYEPPVPPRYELQFANNQGHFW